MAIVFGCAHRATPLRAVVEARRNDGSAVRWAWCPMRIPIRAIRCCETIYGKQNNRRQTIGFRRIGSSAGSSSVRGGGQWSAVQCSAALGLVSEQIVIVEFVVVAHDMSAYFARIDPLHMVLERPSDEERGVGHEFGPDTHMALFDVCNGLAQ